jgi:hypothetical protein
MKNLWALILVLAAASLAISALAGEGKEAAADGYFQVGVGRVDITPTEAVVLAGSPAPRKTAIVDTRLFVKALVIAVGNDKLAIVTLDTLKYPVELATQTRKQIEQAAGIPAGNVIIGASHTHAGPLWSYYHDRLITKIVEAVSLAARDLSPCKIGTAQGKAEGVSENRRVIKDGHAWNRWQLPRADRARYPAEGPVDAGFAVLAAIDQQGRFKGVLFNFACHAANTRTGDVSADYPGDVQKYVNQQLGYDVPAFFLAGACGDVNPAYSNRKEQFGETLGAEIVRCLRELEIVAQPGLWVETRELAMPGRENPVFNEAEVSRNWPGQLEHYRKSFNDMKRKEQPTYACFFTGIRIGNNFAIVTNPNELFCEIGMGIKKQSPFQHTMVAELTNGAHGYVPTAKAFAGGSYETWFGEHSYLSTRAGELIEQESVEILKRLKAER